MRGEAELVHVFADPRLLDGLIEGRGDEVNNDVVVDDVAALEKKECVASHHGEFIRGEFAFDTAALRCRLRRVAARAPSAQRAGRGRGWKESEICRVESR